MKKIYALFFFIFSCSPTSQGCMPNFSKICDIAHLLFRDLTQLMKILINAAWHSYNSMRIIEKLKLKMQNVLYFYR